MWAYGVLVWEVMSRGQHPYSEFATLTEVSTHVKEGYRLGCPPGCNESVHTMIMMPCWNADAAARPGFSSLIETLEHHFEVVVETPDSDDEERSESNGGFNRVPSKRLLLPSRIHAIGAQRAMTTSGLWSSADEANMWLLRGVSVHHLSTVLAPKV